MFTDTVQSSLRVSLFGPLRLRHAAGFYPLKLTGATRDLLSLLLTRAGEATRREELMATFWPEAGIDRGRSALTTALWRVKKMLVRIPELELVSFDDLVAVEVSGNVTIDSRLLEHWTAYARREMNDEGRLAVITRRALADAVRPCTGVFLDGCDAHWALVERERLSTLYLAALGLLMREADERGAIEDALAWGRAILASDPLREAVHHHMIDLYARAGERRRATLQFETLRETLRDELGIEPDPETLKLRNQILSHRCNQKAHSVAPTLATDAVLLRR